jgi:secreted trypsin-like serine protease
MRFDIRLAPVTGSDPARDPQDKARDAGDRQQFRLNRRYLKCFGEKIMRRSFTMGAAAAIAALTQPAAVSAEPIHNAVDTLRPTLNLRVIGGEQSVDGAWPWQVLVVTLVRTADGKTAQFSCGGSVIAPRWVLTAAHCVLDVDQQSRAMIVAEQQDGATVKAMRLARSAVVNRGNVAGRGNVRLASDLDDKGLHLGVTPFVHPGYKSTSPTHENDIALLRLNEDVRSTPVKPLLRADGALESPPVKAIVTGWGRMREVDGDGIDVLTGKKADPEEVEPKHLMEVKIPLVGTNACKEAYKTSTGVIDGRTLCAGVDDGGKDSCQGDSGGPLVTMDRGGLWRQIGVVSWGEGCGRQGFPGIYSRVSAFGGWIRQTVGSDLGDEELVAGPVGPVRPPQQQEPRDDNPAGLTIAFDQGDVVSVNQRVSYRVSANQEGYLAIFDLTPDNTLTQIFPNERALNSPTGRRPEALLVQPGRPRLIPDPRNPYAAFEVVVKERRGKGVIVAVLSEQPLTGLEVPALTKTFATRKQAVVALARVRNGLRAMRGLKPVAINKQVADAGITDDGEPTDSGVNVPQETPQITPQTMDEAKLPKWSIAVHEYQVR